jgi:hypothetical protein
MTPTLSPLSPYTLFGIPKGRRWAVVRDGEKLGEITEVLEDRGARYEWRTPGMVGFDPLCGTGRWWEAVAAVERRAARPVPMRAMPPALDLGRLRREMANQHEQETSS